MRVDLFLKASRLVKRRTRAQALCEAGRVRVDGQPAKAGRQVRPGSRITVDLGRRELVVEVREVTGIPPGGDRGAALFTLLAERRFTGPRLRGEEGIDADIHG
jgi:ribosomal 50S subunit-recycling heat shock protein